MLDPQCTTEIWAGPMWDSQCFAVGQKSHQRENVVPVVFHKLTSEFQVILEFFWENSKTTDILCKRLSTNECPTAKEAYTMKMYKSTSPTGSKD